MKKYLFLLHLLIILLTSNLFTQQISTNTIRGTITHIGRPLDSVTVELAGTVSNKTVTNSSGGYSFLVFSGGSYSITPSKSGYTFKPLSSIIYGISTDETRNFVTELPNDTIRGVVTLGGNPILGVTFSITGDTTLSDTSRSNGSFLFLVQRYGNYTITPKRTDTTKKSYIFVPPSQTFNEINGAKIQNFIAFDSAYLVTGKVTYKSNPLRGVEIRYTGTDTGRVTTDSLGNYMFGVLLNANITVIPSKDGYTFTPVNASFSMIDSNIVQNFVADTIPITPDVPILLSPANGDSTFAVNIDLTWQVAARADSYFLQIATDSSFSSASLLVDRSNYQNTFYPLMNLTQGLTYYWRVASKNMADTSAWSNIWRFRVLISLGDPPILIRPLQNEVDMPLITTLSWDTTKGATSYRIQVSTTSNFSNLFISQYGWVNNSFYLAGLQYYTTYYWRVSASNNSSTTAWSEVRNFRTINNVPDKPTLLAPNNNLLNAALNVNLSWNTVQTASSYRLEVSTNSNFSTVIVRRENLTSLNYALSGLTGSTTYYWRVAAENSAGVGVWSDVWRFTTIVTMPGVPTLLTPANNSVNVNYSVTLNWSTSNYAAGYNLQVSTRQDFDYNNIVDETGLILTQYILNNLEPSTIYYWRVSARNATGSVSAWSSIFIFQTKAPLSGPVPSSPANNSKVNTISQVSLQWFQLTGGADSYTVEVSSNINFSNATSYTTTSTYQYIYNLDYARQYYWRVRATRNNELTSWSNVFSFMTISSIAGPTTIYPSETSYGVGKSATFTWYPISNILGYEVEVTNDVNFNSIIRNYTVYYTYVLVQSMTSNAQLWWRVRGYNANEIGEWSLPVSFRTASDLLAAPVITYPTDNQLNVSINPVVTWNTVASATEYEVILSERADMSDILNLYVSSLPQCNITNLKYATNYYWQVIARRGYDETSEWSPIHKFTTNDHESLVELVGAPDDFRLMQNYPNPFNPKTNIKYSIPKESLVIIKIFNVYGQEIETLVNEHQVAGTYILSWQPNNLPSGIYFYKIQTNEFMDIKKMMFLK
jgi:hypothetical protein